MGNAPYCSVSTERFRLQFPNLVVQRGRSSSSVFAPRGPATAALWVRGEGQDQAIATSRTRHLKGKLRQNVVFSARLAIQRAHQTPTGRGTPSAFVAPVSALTLLVDVMPLIRVPSS